MVTTITISEDVKNDLIEFGSKGEIYNQVLRKILNDVKERQLEIILMDDKDCVPIEAALERAKKRWQ